MTLQHLLRYFGLVLAAAGSLAAAPAEADGLNVRGNVGFEYLRFPQYVGAGSDPSSNPVQASENLAARLQIDASYAANERVSFALRGFAREDKRDHDRTALRLDEAWGQYAAPNWDLRVGNQLVTWGSVESVSPLDIVNPRDYEEDLVEPRKIGTFMGRFRWRFSSSDLSVYWLPKYEPSIFAGPHSYYSISAGLPQYYPDKRWDGSQWAVRYFKSGDGYDLGVSYFSGLERNGTFQFDPSQFALVGTTYPTRRLGLDVTKTIGSLVLKGEFVYRTTHEDGNRRALLYVAGGEYNLSSVWGHSDMTFFAEYLGASRNVREIELMQNDIFLAARWTFNDTYRQRLQLGTFRDLDHGDAHVYRIEYSASPVENVDVMLRYTQTRNYYPGPRHAESNAGAVHLLVKYNF